MMTDEEFAQLARQYGPDSATWPEPYRSAAQPVSGTDALLALVRQASLLPTDSLRTEQAVMRHLRQHQAQTLPFSRRMPAPAFGAAAFALVLVITPVAVAKWPLPEGLGDSGVAGLASGDPFAVLLGGLGMDQTR